MNPVLVPAVSWESGPLDDFAPRAVHRMLQARQAVFVVEQRCVYLDADALDEHCWHLVGWQRGRDAAGPLGGRPLGDHGVDPCEVVAYARLLPPGLLHPAAGIGRVLTLGEGRGVGLGHELMQRAVAAVCARWPGIDIRLSAQAHLQVWYAQHGFVAEGDLYDEDGIAHRAMRRGAAA